MWTYLRLLGLLLAAWLVAPGCSGSGLGSGDATGSAATDGISVEFWLDRLEARIGDRVVAVVRVSNAGLSAPQWERNICEFGPAPITVSGVGPVALGHAWTGIDAEFKAAVLEQAGYLSGDVRLLGRFRNVALSGFLPIACPASSDPGPLRPGDSSTMTVVWPVGPEIGNYSGSALVHASFASTTVEVVAEVQIAIESSGGHAQLTLIDYVDNGLADPAFANWLALEPAATWDNTQVAFWPNPQGQYPSVPEYADIRGQVVEIGLFRTTPASSEFGAVIIALDSGQVLGTRFDP